MVPWTWYAAVALAGAAAATDVRRGLIPNWLTLPVLVGMPFVWLITHGPVALAYSILSAAACALVPFVLYRFGAAGGGDVKLLAALGALVGLDLGIEAELVAFFAALVFALGRMAWRGKLLVTLYNSFQVGLGPVIPKSHRKKIPDEMLTSVRLGGCVLFGVVVSVLARTVFS